MRGFAVVENHPGSSIVVVWQTSQVETRLAAHTNAVQIDRLGDAEDTTGKIRSLTRGRIVVLTEGSVLDGLPLDEPPLTVQHVVDMLGETEERQQRIISAVHGYGRQSGSNAISPTFSPSPRPQDFIHEPDSAKQHALQTANFLAAAWAAWLVTEEERRRRTVQPRTGRTPWMMPDSLNDPQIAVLPPGFAEQASPEALV